MIYEEFKLSYRKPSEFVWNNIFGIPTNRPSAFRVWLFHCWKTDMMNYYISYGIRICGIELCWKRYLGYTYE